jgi:hypothetical protein
MNAMLRDSAARRINARPWKPLAGFVKRECEQCHYFFACPQTKQTERCLDCEAETRSASRKAPS